MDYFDDNKEAAEDILDNELKVKNLMQFKYFAKIDDELKLKACFYNSGLHLTDTSKLRLTLRSGAFSLEEKIKNLKDTKTEIAYDTESVLPNSQVKGIVCANIPNKEINSYSFGFGYHNAGKFDSETCFVRELEEIEPEKGDSEKPQANETLRKVWKSSLEHACSGSLYSTPTASFGFGFNGIVKFEEKGPEVSIPEVGVTYQRAGQSHTVRYEVENLGKTRGLLQYLCHKNLTDQAALGVRLGRDFQERKNTVEIGLKYQPRKDFVMRGKIDHEGYLYSGFSFQFTDYIRASVSTRHNFKAYPKSSAPNQCGIIRTPMLFKLTFGV